MLRNAGFLVSSDGEAEHRVARGGQQVPQGAVPGRDISDCGLQVWEGVQRQAGECWMCLKSHRA